MQKTSANNKRRYDAKRRSYPRFTEGDLVLIQRTSPPTDCSPKMAPKFIGPFMIKKALDKDRYVVVDVPGRQHSQRPYEGILPPERLKSYTEGADFDEDGSETDELDADERETDEIEVDGREADELDADERETDEIEVDGREADEGSADAAETAQPEPQNPKRWRTCRNQPPAWMPLV